jgi:rRNA maturation protein Nop10
MLKSVTKKRKKVPLSDTNWLDKTPEERHHAMSWMQRLKRVFNIDMENCEKCGGHVKVTALAHPARAALVRPCTSSPALKTQQ